MGRETLAEQQWAAVNNAESFINGLKDQLSKKGIDTSEIHADSLSYPPSESPIEASPSSMPKMGDAPSTYEHGILSLLDVRDSLIDGFRKFDEYPEVTELLLNCIKKIEKSIQDLGGTTDQFDPLEQISGLEKKEDEVTEEALLANARRVAENTKDRYALFPITKMIVKSFKGRPGILLQFDGIESGSRFVVNGQVVAKSDFSGNEAIDYVRVGGQQKLTVKAFRLGKWTDVSADFIIRYKDATPDAETTQSKNQQAEGTLLSTPPAESAVNSDLI